MNLSSKMWWESVKFVLEVTGIAVDLEGTINPLKTKINLYTIIVENSVRTAQ